MADISDTISKESSNISPQSSGSNDVEQEANAILLFPEARIHLKRLVDDWKTEVNETQVRRDIRDVEVNVEALRNEGKLDEDETLVPVRVIDVNIQREQPPYINYLSNSRRLAIFNCLSNPEVNTQKLEQDFTRGMTYAGWVTPFYKAIDGAQTHGWDIVEVVYDETKPLHVSIEHVGHDNLFFAMTGLNIQYAPRIVRKFDVTLLQLKRWVVQYGFSEEQVQKIIDASKNTQKADETIKVYKNFFKKEGQVFVAWFCLELGVNDWLKAPEALQLGIKEQQAQVVTNQQTGQPEPKTLWVDKPITQYPIFILPYRETEKPKITDHKGRVFLDENKQEAQTAILSGYINGLTRASQVYAATGQEDGTGSSLKEIQNVKLSGGRILNKPINFWSPPYPDPQVLRALQYFDVSNSQETHQLSFAVMNRADSRKTAKEIDASQNEQTKLDSVQLTLFSTFIREVYSFAWLIVQSQALQNNIKFLLVKQQIPQANPVMGGTMTGTDGQPQVKTMWVNDTNTVNNVFEVRAAGDVDVIARQEKIAMMKQDWGVVSNTILKDEFLAELIKLEYPEQGERWSDMLRSNGQLVQMQGMLARYGMIMQAMIEKNPEMIKTLPPEQQSDLSNMIQQSATIAQQMQANKPVGV